METTRIMLSWEPRGESPEDAAKRLISAFAWLGALPGLEGAWTGASADRRVIPCGSMTEVASHVARGAAPALPGSPSDAAPDSYRQFFYLGSFRRWRAMITLVCGVPPLPDGARIAIGRLDLIVRSALPLAVQRQALLGLVGVYRPVWGFAGTERAPKLDTIRQGTPPVGWLSYLSSWFGPSPSLPAPAVVSPLQHLGTLVQASPEAFDPANGAHARRLGDVEKALRESGILKRYWIPAEPRGGGRIESA